MNRDNIYYWKCDRAFAFHSINGHASQDEFQYISRQVQELLAHRFNDSGLQVRRGNGQGNHLTFLADHNNQTYFIRLENGPEKDNYMLVEQKVIEAVREKGVPTATIYETNASRKEVNFAYQLMEYLDYPDLNQLYKSKELEIKAIATEIGRYIAMWQSVAINGFGPFNTEIVSREGKLQGLHADYPSYFFLNLHKHLAFLTLNNFLTEGQALEIVEIINSHKEHLFLKRGCLVHKDMALWNLLGLANQIKAVIDWDDAISGDPTDDLSLLACFHDQEVVDAALKGYTSIRALPHDFEVRFQLHLLRNMIVKAVIRVGANYFEKNDDFFLIDSGEEGSSLEQITRTRIFSAVEVLRKNIPHQV